MKESFALSSFMIREQGDCRGTYCHLNISEKFVEGFFIGYVSEVQVDSNNLTKTGTIVTPVDFLHLKDVFVITVNKQDQQAQVEGMTDS